MGHVSPDDRFALKAWFDKFISAFCPFATHFSMESSMDGLQTLLAPKSTPLRRHPNLDAVIFTITTPSHRFIFSPFVEHTLADVLSFNPDSVTSSATKRALLAKQLLSAFAEMHHERGFAHGSLSARDVLVDQNLWISVRGCERQALFAQARASELEATDISNCTERWCRGELSNFDYIMELNRRAGRHFGDPSLHPIMPWVTDFTGAAPEAGRRDLARSKFRLNKGDEQLDLQFADVTPGSTPHHITHLLSDVTYFVYLARRTPIAVLRRFVRSKYEPNEYPVSMRRVFEWTPDESIPEFYSDPSIFSSLHSDMPDLQLPEWASSPEDFISKHRAALESPWVSSELHEWIDLTFGYLLTGDAAVEAKNVALPLTSSGSGHDRLAKHGIHQLFTLPHPRRFHSSSTTASINVLTDALEGQVSPEPSVRERFAHAFAALSISTHTGASRGSPIPGLLSTPDARRGHARQPSLPSSTPGSAIRHQRSFSRTLDEIPLPPSSPPPAETIGSPNLREAMIEVLEPMEGLSSRRIEIAGTSDFLEPVAEYEAINGAASSLRSGVVEAPEEPEEGRLPRSRAGSGLLAPTVEHSSRFGQTVARDIWELGRILLQLAVVPDRDARDKAAASLQPFRIDAALADATSSAKLDVLLRLAPRSCRGALKSMLSPDWTKRPTSAVVLQDSSDPQIYDAATTLPFPNSANIIFDYTSRYELSDPAELVDLTAYNLEILTSLDDDSFHLLLPYVLPLFSTGPRVVEAWRKLFDPLTARIGCLATLERLLRPLAALVDSALKDPAARNLLFSAPFLRQLVRRFGLTAFCEKVLPLFIPDALQTWTITSSAASPSAPSPEDLNNPDNAVVHAVLGICSLLGPILTGKYATQPLLSVVLRDASFAPVLHYMVVLLGARFGELFIVHQFFPLFKGPLEKAHKPGPGAATRYCMVVNSLALMEKFANHVSQSSLVSEMNEMAPMLSRLIESLTLPELDYADEHRKVICVRSFSYLVRLADLLNGQTDWRPQILPILIRFFAGAVRFVGQSRKPADPSRPNLSIYSPEVVGQIFASFQALMGRELLTRVPTSSSIERMLRERPSDQDRGFEERLAEVVTRTNSSIVFENSHWTSDAGVRPPARFGRSTSLPLSPPGSNNGSAATSRKPSGNEAAASSAASLSSLGERLTDNSDFSLSLDSVLTRPLRSSDSKVRPAVARIRPEANEDRSAWARLLSTTNEVSRETTEMTFRDLKLRTYVGHGSRINVVAEDECSRLVATGSRDRTVKLWSLNSIHRDIELGTANSDAAHTFGGHQRGVVDVAFLDSSLVSCDGNVHLWSVETGQLMHQFEIKSRVVSLLASQNMLIGATSDNFLSWVPSKGHVH